MGIVLHVKIITYINMVLFHWRKIVVVWFLNFRLFQSCFITRVRVRNTAFQFSVKFPAEFERADGAETHRVTAAWEFQVLLQARKISVLARVAGEGEIRLRKEAGFAQQQLLENFIDLWGK